MNFSARSNLYGSLYPSVRSSVYYNVYRSSEHLFWDANNLHDQTSCLSPLDPSPSLAKSVTLAAWMASAGHCDLVVLQFSSLNIVFFSKILKYSGFCFSLFSLVVSVCTRQVEHLRCSNTGRVQKNSKILRKSTIINEHPVYLYSHHPFRCVASPSLTHSINHYSSQT